VRRPTPASRATSSKGASTPERAKTLLPALRASYALTGSLETASDHGDVTGVHIILSDGGTDSVREQQAAALLETGFVCGASRFRLIEGSPEPPAWLQSSRPTCRTR